MWPLDAATVTKTSSDSNPFRYFRIHLRVRVSMKIRSSLRLAPCTSLSRGLHLSLTRLSRVDRKGTAVLLLGIPLLSSSLSHCPSSPTSLETSRQKRCVLIHDHSPAPPPEGGPHRGQLQRKPAAACQMVAHAPVVGGDAFFGGPSVTQWDAVRTWWALSIDVLYLHLGLPVVAARGGDRPLVVAQVSDRA